MKRVVMLTGMIASVLLVFPMVASAAAKSGHAPAAHAAAAAPSQFVSGEIVDMGCYAAHGAKGEKHKGCASKCIAGGTPMGLLTADGKLYILALDHDDAGAYAKCKSMAAENVKVTGEVHARNGVTVIDVKDVQASK
jgi:hypothetical protein